MRRSTLSSIFLLSFLAATGLLEHWQKPMYPFELYALILIIGFFGLIPRTRFLIPLSLGLLIALASVSRTTHVPDASSIDAYADGSKVELTGIVAREPDRRPTVTRYTIATESLTVSGHTLSVHGLTLISDYSQYPEAEIGQRISVSGKLERPGVIDGFAYDQYLSRYDVQSILRSTHLTIEPGFHGFVLRRTLQRMKRAFEERINRIYPEPHASFLAGLLTGSRRGIPQHLTDAFNTTGLTHIIAISGTNITIILSVIAALLFWLPLKWRFVPSIIAITLFTIFVGASASVVRAAIMGCLGLFALQIGRLADARLTMLWTAFVMVSWNPKVLWYDAGFQLSFLALIGLMELSPIMGRWLEKVPNVIGLRTSLSASLSAQVATMPWIFFLFGRISLIAPLANVLAVPLVPIAMLLGFLSVVASYFWFPLGQAIGYVTWLVLQIIIATAELCASIPFSSIALH